MKINIYLYRFYEELFYFQYVYKVFIQHYYESEEFDKLKEEMERINKI